MSVQCQILSEDQKQKIHSESIRILEEMVQQALKTAPKPFVLGSRVKENDFHLPSSYSGYVLDNEGVLINYNTFL